MPKSHQMCTHSLWLMDIHFQHCISKLQPIAFQHFPPHQQKLLREQLSSLLQGVVSMRLLPKKDGQGLIPAAEILASTPTIKDLLYNGKTREIYKALQEGSYYGTQTFNQSLKGLYEKEHITLEDALAAADNEDELKLELRGIKKGSGTGDFNFSKFERPKPKKA